MRIVFAGTPVNAAQTLEALLAGGFSVVGVLTRADAARGRQRTVLPSEVAQLAEERGLPLFKTNRIDEAARIWLRSLGADLGVIVAYGAILGTDDLEIPRHGWINLHYSLLPELPGAAPVQHALIRGLKTTGVSVFRLNEGLDSGPILAQRSIEIHSDWNAGELLKNLSLTGSELLAEVLNSLPKGFESAKEQQHVANRKLASKPSREFAKLDFNSTASELLNLVRGLNPEPMAWFSYLETPVRVLRAKVSSESEIAFGMARLVAGQLVVGCAGGALELIEVQPAGKKPMPAADWFRGLRAEEIKLT